MTFQGLMELVVAYFCCKWTPGWWINSATEVKIHVVVCLIISHTLCSPAGVAFWWILPPGPLPGSLRETFRYVCSLYHSTRAFQISRLYVKWQGLFHWGCCPTNFCVRSSTSAFPDQGTDCYLRPVFILPVGYYPLHFQKIYWICVYCHMSHTDTHSGP